MDEEQASASLDEPTDLETEIYGGITRLLRKAWKRRVSLRLVSLKLSNLYDGRFRGLLALDAPARQHEAQQRLADVVDALREKFGRGVVLRGHDFILRIVRARHQLPMGRSTSVPRLRTIVAAGKRSAGHPPSPRSAAAEPERGNSISASPGAEFRSRVEGRRSSPSSPITTSVSTRHTGYVPLNVHSYYSFLDSTLSINAIIDLAKRHELPAIALTDKNNLHGAVEFAEAAAARGSSPSSAPSSNGTAGGCASTWRIKRGIITCAAY